MKTIFTKTMSLWALVLVLFVGILFTNTAYSQTTVTIGTATTTNGATSTPSPYALYYTGDKSQYLFTAAELLAGGGYGGVIQAIAFNVLTPAPVSGQFGSNLKNYTIKMKNTSTTAFTGVIESGLTQVYTVSSYASVTGWNTHSFTTPFTWDGTSNLIIEICFDNYVSGPDKSSNAVAYYSAGFTGCTQYFRSDGGNVCSNTTSTATVSANRPNIKFSFAPIVPLDASITTINAPVSPIGPGNQTVTATLRNYGTSTLTSATLGWSVDGVTQTAPAAWTGSLATGTAVPSPITIGTFNFTAGTHTIKVWSKLPNGSADMASLNDTATKTMMFQTPYSGTYTIGAAPSDFTSFGAAITAMISYGINGPITFNVKTGTYTEQVTIPATIAGVSATNTITFKSLANNADSVLLQNAGTSALPWTLKLDGADYISFKKMTIKNTDLTYSRVIELANGAHYNTFESNKILSSSWSSSSAYCIYDGTTLNNYNTYLNNYLFGGYYTMYIYGSSPTICEKGTVIKGNEIVGSGYYPMYIYYSDSVQIVNNYVHDNSNVYTYGISANYANNGFNISGNRVYSVGSSTTSSYGIRVSYGNDSTYNPTPSAFGIVSNNFISIYGSSANHYGLYAFTDNGTEYSYNSVNIANGSLSSYALYQYNVASNTLGQKFRNNIFSNKAGSFCIYVNNPAQVSAFDYNDLYSNADTIWGYWGVKVADLSALQTLAPTFNVASISVNPGFLTNTDLHVNNPALNASALALANVTTDIDGQARDASTPDMGADEFTPNMVDAGIFSFVGPIAPCPNSVASVVVSIKNFGVNALTTCNVNWTVNGVAQTPYAFTGSITNGSSALATIGTYTFLPNVTYNFKFWTSAPNASSDQNTVNDTLYYNNFFASITAGTYSIGSGAGDTWPTFTAAVTALTSKGICGPIVINVASGTYNEKVTINAIAGSSSTNTVTIKSLSGNKADVVLQDSAFGTLDNWVLKLNGAQYFTFKNITIKANNITYANVVELSNSANYNTFESNLIQSMGTSSANRGINQNTGLSHYNTFLNNVFVGGYYGIYINGLSSIGASNWIKGAVIKGNECTGFYYTGIYTSNTDSVQVINNYVHDGVGSTTYIGISCNSSNNSYNILGNKIILSGTGACTGLRDYFGNYYTYNTSMTGNGVIANNFVTISGGAATHNGLYSYYSNGTLNYFNSINIVNGSATSAALYQNNDVLNPLGTTYKNNIWANKGGGYAANYIVPTSVTASDNNVFYSISATNFVYWGTSAISNLATYQTTSGKDAASLSMDPSFASNTDLHLNNPAIDDHGTPVSILNDFDGDVRNASTPDIGADEFNSINLDAGILSIDAPVAACPGVPSNVIVTLKNYGLTALTTSQIGWSVNGVAQTPFTYTGSLANGAFAQVTIGTFTMAANTIYNFKIWPVSVNSVADQKASNDTAYISKKSALPSGTYTIGASGADYPTFNAAINVLKAQGVCGPVVFNVANGTYNEQIILNEVIGASATNTITFNSASNDSTAVILQYAASSSTDNFVVRLDGADFIRFSKITVKSSAPAAATYGQVFDVLNSAQYNVITNCIVQGVVTTSSSANVINSSSITGFDSHNKITNNVILNGYNGIGWQGASSSYEYNNVISGNNVSNFHYNGILTYYQDSGTVTNNTVTKLNSTTSAYCYYILYGTKGGLISGNTANINQFTYTNYGIYVATINNGLTIENNKITSTNTSTNYGIYISNCDSLLKVLRNDIKVNSTGIAYGIYIGSCDGKASAPLLVANNMLSITATTGTQYGLYSSSSYFTNFFNNSVLLTGGLNTAGSTAYFTGGGSDSIYNNIFSNTNSGYAYYVVTTAAILASDNNNFYTNGTKLAYWGADKTDLAALQTSSGKELYSLSVNPKFKSSTNLHLTIYSPNNFGAVRSSVPNDIDNEVRSLISPDMGADEWTPASHDMSALNVVAPTNNLCGSATDQLRVVVLNNGDSLETNVSVNAIVTTPNGVVSKVAILPSTVSTHIDSLNLGYINTSSPGTYTVKAYTSLGTDSDRSNDTVVSTFVIQAPVAIPFLEDFSTAANWTGNMSLNISGTYFLTSDALGYTLSSTATSFTESFTKKAGAITANSKLSFDYRIVKPTSYALDTLGKDSIWVKISTDCGATYNNVLLIDSFSFIPSTTFKHMVLPLGAYAGNDVLIKIQGVWKSGAHLVHFDNIGISEPVAINLGNDKAICAGDSTMLDAGAAPLGYTLTYAWGKQGSATSYGTTPTIYVNAAGKYYVNTTTQFGITTTDTIIITENALPIVTYSGLNDNYCLNASNALLTGSPVGGTFSGMGMSGNSFSPATAGIGMQHVVYSYTDANLCTAKAHDSTEVLAIPVFTTSNDTSICLGTSATISVIDTGFTYLWSTTATTQSITVNPTVNKYYSVAVSNTNCTVNDSVLVSVLALPVVNLGVDTSLCASNSINLNAGAGFTSYLWSNAATTATTTIDSTGTGVGAKTVWAKVTDANTCVNSDTIVVSFTANPIATITGPAQVKRSHELVLNANSGFASYIWNTGATTATLTIPGNTLPPSVTLTFTVTVTNAAGCSGTTSHVVNVLNDVSINESSANYFLSVYPNPTTGVFHLNIQGFDGMIDMSIVDITGKAVYSEKLDVNTNFNKDVDATNLSRGVYYLKMVSETGVRTEKLIVQ